MTFSKIALLLSLLPLLWSACKSQHTANPAGAEQPAQDATPTQASQKQATMRTAHFWEGAISLPNGTALSFYVHFTPLEDKPGYAGRLSIPSQGTFDAPLTDVVYEASKIEFSWPPAGARWIGTADLKHRIECELQQSGLKFACEMEPVTEKEFATLIKPARPQEPKPPFPYEIQEVEYTSTDGTRLAGSLTLPQTSGPHPVVILISGSGPQDRDETIMGHKPFFVIADYLTRHGIAVLRTDDRGVGKSSGSFPQATMEDFSKDVLAGVDFLKQQASIDKTKIGLIGHSEGGVIAPQVATQSKDIAFIVMLAGTGVPGDELLLHQNQLIYRAMGIPEKMQEDFLVILREILQILRKTETNSEASQQVKAYIESLPEDKIPGGDKQTYSKMVDAMVSAAWFRSFINHDPRPILQKLKVPVLVLNGELDLQVDPQQNLPEIRKALKKAKNKRVTIEQLPGLNHLFQEAKTGLPGEYATIEQTISLAVLQMMATWIAEQT